MATVTSMSSIMHELQHYRYYINYYIHIHVQENNEEEEKLLKIIETSVMSGIESLNSLINMLLKCNINRSNISFRSTVSCPKEDVIRRKQRTTWPTTLIGHSTYSEELCVGDNGEVIERECLGDFNSGAFWGPIQGECAHHVTSSLTARLHNLSRIQITKYNVLSTCFKMNKLTSASRDLSVADVQFVEHILRNAAVISDIQPEVLRSVMNTVDHAISAKHRQIGNINSNVSWKILFAVKSMLVNLDTSRRVFQAAGSNIVVSAFPYSGNTTTSVEGVLLKSWNSNLTVLFNGTGKEDFISSFREFEAGMLLPENMTSNRWREVGEDLEVLVYKNVHPAEENLEVVSPVIDASVRHKNIYDMDPPIEMVFRITQVEQDTSYKCVFRDLNDKCGRWSSKGCSSRYLDSTHVLCSCDRLASFAVISEGRSSLKEFEIHFSGCALYTGWAFSMFGLLIIILTFVLFKEYRKKLKHKVLFNLSLSLFVYMLTIVAGLERRNSTVLGCAVVAVLLHYLMLTSFAWMLVEAFVQYHCLVKVIGTYIPRFMQKASLFAWGLPLLIVGITLSTDCIIYITPAAEYCWPNAWVSNKSFYYGVAGPAVTMSAMTFVIFVLILRSTCRGNANCLRTHHDERKARVARAQAILCVSVLLGISWIYGIVNVYANRLFVQYIYAAILTLLGIFIFIYFVFLCKETRDLWSSLLPTTPPVWQYFALMYLCVQQSCQPTPGATEKIELSLYSRIIFRMREEALVFVNW